MAVGKENWAYEGSRIVVSLVHKSQTGATRNKRKSTYGYFSRPISAKPPTISCVLGHGRLLG